MLRSWLFAAAAAAVSIPSAAQAEAPRFTVDVAQAQPGAASDWSQVVASAMMPSWYRRAGEGPFSFRSPLSNLYLIVGGHAGFGRDTTLEDEGGCGPNTFFINCTNARPSGGLGTGGGASLGVGTRLAPALRVAVIATVEGGYRFRNDTPWVQSGAGSFAGNAFVEDIPIRSFQGSFNIYLDAAGLFAPGALGRWNPYVMGGVGIASNVASDVTETQLLPGGGAATNTFAGGTHTSFLWTAGIGVQYLLAMGTVIDLGYQYVDAGRFVANGGGVQDSGLDPVRGELRTHRVGLALNVDFNALSRLIGGR